MEMHMKTTSMHKIVQAGNLFSREARSKRRLGRALQAWPSADALAFDLSEQGIERDISTLNRYRAGQTTPPAWLYELLMEMAVAQTRNQITALQARLKEIGRTKCGQAE